MAVPESKSEIFETIGRETIAIFSQIVKEKKVVSPQTLSEMYSQNSIVSSIISDMMDKREDESRLYELNELKEKLREKKYEIDDIESAHRKKSDLLLKVIRTLSILSKSDNNQAINGLIEKLNESIKSEQAFRDDTLENTLGELRQEVLNSENSGTQEKSRKKSFLGDFFKGSKTAQAPAEEATWEKKIREMLVAIVLRLQMQQADFDRKAHTLVDEIKKDDLATLNNLTAKICELIGAYKERLNDEKDSLYELVQEIATKLVDTEKDLIQAFSENQAAANTQNSDFNESFTKDIKGIEESFQQGNSIDEIKNLVFEKLGNIKSSLQKKKEQDIRLLAEAQVHLDRFKTNLKDQETEILKVRERTDLDALTGAYNKNAFQHRLKEEFKDYSSSKNSTSIIVFDMDNFRKINEKYSFDNGDRILQTITKVVTERKPQDFFFAYNGGGEFVMLLPVGLDEARDYAENLKKLISEIDFYHMEEKVPVSISLGVAAFLGEKNPVQILQKAHGALREAKRKGKNQVSVSR